MSRRERTARADQVAVRAGASNDLRERLTSLFRWVGDAGDDSYGADVSGWWADAEILNRLGSALGALHEPAGPVDAVIGPESSGLLVGALAAQALGVGLIAVRKQSGQLADSDRWRLRTSPPDYQDRHLQLGVPRRLLPAGLRVLFVDDWIDTGGHALAVRGLVEDAGASWVGAAVVVDALDSSRLRRDLAVKSLVHVRDL